jgi:hypothetical protein
MEGKDSLTKLCCFFRGKKHISHTSLVRYSLRPKFTFLIIWMACFLRRREYVFTYGWPVAIYYYFKNWNRFFYYWFFAIICLFTLARDDRLLISCCSSSFHSILDCLQQGSTYASLVKKGKRRNWCSKMVCLPTDGRIPSRILPGRWLPRPAGAIEARPWPRCDLFDPPREEPWKETMSSWWRRVEAEQGWRIRPPRSPASPRLASPRSSTKVPPQPTASTKDAAGKQTTCYYRGGLRICNRCESASRPLSGFWWIEWQGD